ncbi:hypothetical protein ZIOFF_066437 [Zingiber officinale]|uniref:Uncharacterized protein n=1 Tax=Zingiber officinale TaxID=94328 RepID=A0A8J5F039_ZINOF|nr:hypothetical protein ZIOFF_066437 [Zingiber officinale]
MPLFLLLLVEEPVTIEFPEKQVQRCFTLEEATDTILFCSSIVHDIGYKAATIAVDKDFAVRDSLHRPITFLGSTISNHKDFQKASSGRTRSPKRIKRKKQETADKMTSIELTKNVANSEITSCDNKVTNTIDSAKPPKLESKCNCTVMLFTGAKEEEVLGSGLLRSCKNTTTPHHHQPELSLRMIGGLGLTWRRATMVDDLGAGDQRGQAVTRRALASQFTGGPAVVAENRSEGQWFGAAMVLIGRLDGMFWKDYADGSFFPMTSRFLKLPAILVKKGLRVH